MKLSSSLAGTNARVWWSHLLLPLVVITLASLADGFSLPITTTTTTTTSAASVCPTATSINNRETQQPQPQQFAPSKKRLSVILQLRGGGDGVGGGRAPATVLPSSSSFSSDDRKAQKQQQRQQRRQQQTFHSRFLQKTVLFQTTADSSSSSSSAMNSNTNVPRFVYNLNSSTKWLVTLANTLGIWTRVPKFEGPYVVVGAIVAVYGTEVLKQIINQDRPDGAPSFITDPGMPSSHSLVSFFMACAWTTSLRLGVTSSTGAILIWLGAAVVALLRVVCGYHSWDQIGVGAVLGIASGWSWSKLGLLLAKTNPRATQLASWGLYSAGSALFIGKNMKDWIHKDKHL